MERNRCLVLADALDDAGHGVGVDRGVTVHVADLLPGEQAEVALEHASPHTAQAWGRVARRIGPASPDRVAPACPAFGRCGGCVWQHLAYPAQLGRKHDRVTRALGPGIAVAPVEPSPAERHYRNKGKYVAARLGRRLILGAFAPRTHAVIDTAGCQIVAPIVDEVAAWIRGAAEAAELEPYDEATRRGDLRYAVVRASAAGTVSVTLCRPFSHSARRVPSRKPER